MTKPFLKWPGGKRWLLLTLEQVIAGYHYTRYVEPFLGGGAVFFHWQPNISLLSDVNADLINTYEQVKVAPYMIIEKLRQLPVDLQTYNRFRQIIPTSPLDQAVRFLYLNRTAFGGMYRVNQEGSFNVPFGGGQRTPEILWRDGLLLGASEALQKATICVADFEMTLDKTGEGDLVYCDPTFTVAHNQNGFIRYNERNFSWRDQQRLAQACRRARDRGAVVLISNAFHHEVAALYPNEPAIVVTRVSVLCPNPSKRQPVQEYLFLLWPSGVNPITLPAQSRDVSVL